MAYPYELEDAIKRKATALGYSASSHVQAANLIAGTKNWPLVGALNVIAGNKPGQYRELEGVLNQLAGTHHLGANAAASRWAGN